MAFDPKLQVGQILKNSDIVDTVSLLKSRLMCYNISGDENEEIRDNH